VDLVFSYVGYEPVLVSLILERDTLLNVELQPAGLPILGVEWRLR